MLIANAVSLQHDERLLLDNVSIQFRPGELYGILGANGSGKTTLLKLLSGIWRPTAGEVLWGGEPLHQKHRQEISRLISLVPQSPLVPFDFTAYEMVSMGRYPHGQSGKTPREKELILESLHQVDAYQLAHRRINELSIGERQRLYIARALTTEAPVLLLDEPTASLDIRHEMEIWEILAKLLSEGKTVVAVLHNIAAAKHYCKQIVALKEGRCCATGPMAEVMTPALLEHIYGVKLPH